MPDIVKWPFPKHPGIFWKVSTTLTVGTVGMLSKMWLEWFNTVRVHNKHVLFDALENRPTDTPLITVSNHHSCMDDPILWGILNVKHLYNEKLMRWSLTAHDICFTNEFHSMFFARGKCIPIVRGNGVYQQAMDFCIQELNRGHWTHIFPEGKVNVNHEFIRFKWGIGRLVDECCELPIVLPMWHMGMDDVLPTVEPYIPQMGKKVTVYVGNRIEIADLVQELREQYADPEKKRKIITDYIQERVYALKEVTEELHKS